MSTSGEQPWVGLGRLTSTRTSHSTDVHACPLDPGEPKAAYNSAVSTPSPATSYSTTHLAAMAARLALIAVLAVALVAAARGSSIKLQSVDRKVRGGPDAPRSRRRAVAPDMPLPSRNGHEPAAVAFRPAWPPLCRRST